jgi:hypothetical protein
MVKVTNVLGEVLSGTVAKTAVYAKWKGREYRRKYVVPSNPRTPAQMAVRESFANAVDMWHSFNPLQSAAYTPLASGQVKSGFNLFVGEWQKMTAAERSAFVKPYYGFKQIAAGAAVTGQTLATALNTADYTTVNAPIVLGSVTFTKNAGSFDPDFAVELNTGKLYVLKAIASAITISYTAGGHALTNVAVANSANAGDVIDLSFYGITPKTVHVKVGGAEVDSFEFDAFLGTFHICNTATVSVGGTFNFSKYTPVVGATYQCNKSGTNFNAFRGYSSAQGIVPIGVTADHGNYDVTISMSGYITQTFANISPLNTGKTELISLVSMS